MKAITQIKNSIFALVLLLAMPAMAEDEPSRIGYDMAVKIMDAAEAYARDKEWKVTILVTDQNAHPVMLRRLDGAYLRSLSIVNSKARVVTQTGLSTRDYADKLKAGEIAELEGEVKYIGGIPVYSGDVLLGAITVSGVKGYEDEEVAMAGLAAISDSLSK